MKDEKNHKNSITLIGGTSHCGKTTTSNKLCLRFGFNLISTDEFAKHPGRPWKNNPMEIPNHVKEHYLNLTRAQLSNEVVNHYLKQKDKIENAIKSNFDIGKGVFI